MKAYARLTFVPAPDDQKGKASKHVMLAPTCEITGKTKIEMIECVAKWISDCYDACEAKEKENLKGGDASEKTPHKGLTLV